MHAREDRSHPYASTMLVALVVMLGFQLVRVFIPLVGWYLRDVRSLGAFDLIPYALGPFAAAFLLAPLARMLGPRAMSMVAVGGLIASRVVEQVQMDAAADLWVSMIGVGFFLWSLPMLTGLAREALAPGFLLGMAADTALKGATRTLDLSWYDEAWALVTVCVLAGALLVLLVPLAIRSDLPFWFDRRSARSLVVVGPLLLFEWFILQNQGWVASGTGWSPTLALALITAANAFTIWIVVSGHTPRLLDLLGAAAIAGLGFFGFDLHGVPFAALTVVAIVGGGALLAAALTPEEWAEENWRTSFALAFGNLLMVVLALLYFIANDRDLFGLTNRLVLAIAGMVVVVAAVVVVAQPRRLAVPPVTGATWMTSAFVLLPLALPAMQAVGEGIVDPGPTITVMSYNIHSAFDGEGIQNPESIAEVIEQSDADVVGLQEVSRGWFLNGGTDVTLWLSERLDMPHVFFVPAADPAWGNAILSRYPLQDLQSGLLPLGRIPFQRSYQIALVDVDDPLWIINTHLQQVDDPSIPDEERERDLAQLHREQLGVVLRAWDGRTASVLTGDLNAQPGWEQIEYLLAAGFVDGLAALTPEAAWTSGYWTNDGVPRWRVDWIVHTPDMEVFDASVIADDTSDHYPVVVTFRR